MPVKIIKPKKVEQMLPIDLIIDQARLAEIVKEQALFKKKFFDAVAGKDMSDPYQAMGAIFKTFETKE